MTMRKLIATFVMATFACLALPSNASAEKAVVAKKKQTKKIEKVEKKEKKEVKVEKIKKVH
jgi:hypothetical protein